jgi:hypothetical protein
MVPFVSLKLEFMWHPSDFQKLLVMCLLHMETNNEEYEFANL